jgi:hypothetical protein
MSRQGKLSVFIVVILVMVLAFVPVGQGKYFGKDVGSPSCGDAYSCHGEEQEEFDYVISGPHEVEVNEVIPYTVTMLDGPGDMYGFYAVVQRPDGKFQDISGNPLVVVTSSQRGNTSHDSPLGSNHVVLNFTAPKYGGVFKLIIVVLSGNGDGQANSINDSVFNVDTVSEDGLNWTRGDQTGSMDGQTLKFSDDWTIIEKEIKVEYPHKTFSPEVLFFGCGVSLFVLLSMVIFIIQKKRSG